MNDQETIIQNLDLPTQNPHPEPQKKRTNPLASKNKKIFFILLPLLGVLLLLLVLSLFVKPQVNTNTQKPTIPTPQVRPISTPVLNDLDQKIQSIQNDINSSQTLPLPDINSDISL